MHLIALLTLSLAFSSYAKEDFTINVKTATCLQHKVHQRYNAAGSASASKRKDFFASQSGVIDFISQKQGQRVSNGEVILTIEKDLAESLILQARSSYNEALLSLKRNQNLYDKKVISLEALENIKLQASAAKLALAKATKEYQGMVFTAPFDGTLGVIDYNEGDYLLARPANPELLFSIIDETKPAVVRVYLPDFLINKIASDAKVVITYNNKDIDGKISSQAAYISKANAGFLVSVLLESPHNIPDGAAVNCEFAFDEHMAKTLPEQAVSKNNNGDVVFLVQGDKVKELVVKTGIRQNGMIEIISDNLDESSVVVVQGISKLYDGAKVKIAG